MDASATAAPASAAPRVLTRPVALLFAVACGLAVANVYFAQPLLDAMADEFAIRRSVIGAVITVTQIGYGLGLLLVVPLGDLLDRRRLVVGQSLLSVVALCCVGAAPSAAALFVAMAALGGLAVVTQVLVAYAAALAAPGERGRTVGMVTSGIVIGILLARTASGAVADLAGWRAIYWVSAALTLGISALLAIVLPRRDAPRARLSYPRLIASVFTLFVELRVLRVRAVLALLIFADIVVLLTPLVLPLSAPPFSLSHTAVGLFGLAGAAGALAAARAGELADRGHAERTTGVALAIMALSWIPISLLGHSLGWLVLGVIAIDFALQAVHVSNQSLIYRERPDAQSRLTAGYMIFYSLGSASGAIASTAIYSHAGWWGVSLLGALIAMTAFGFWAITRSRSSRNMA